MGALEHLNQMRNALSQCPDTNDIACEIEKVQNTLLEAIDCVVTGKHADALEYLGGWAPCPKCGIRYCYLTTGSMCGLCKHHDLGADALQGQLQKGLGIINDTTRHEKE